MAGGLLQIIAYGAQDMYLTNNPQITFFKTVYRRHTNFSIESFEYGLLDDPNFGSKNSVTISRNGDLISKIYLRVVINKVIPKEGERFAWVRRLGHALLDYVQLTIGGAMIDRMYGAWLDVWYELVTRKKDNQLGLRKMLGDIEQLTELNEKPKPEYTLFIPLKFYFNRHWGLALPMIGIQYHQVSLDFVFIEREKLIVVNKKFSDVSGRINMIDVSILVDYIFLDKTERRRFGINGHEYLIEQVQFDGEEGIENSLKKMRLAFSYPVKEIVWFMKNGIYTSGKEFLCYSHKDDWTDEILKCAKQIIRDSIILRMGVITEIDAYGNEIIVSPPEDPPSDGDWEEFEAGSEGVTANGKITVINQSMNNSLWVNTDSLIVDGYSLTDKISATIEVFSDGDEDIIKILDVSTTLNARDFSITMDRFNDTRIASDNIIVRQFTNYGVWIDGNINPIAYSMLEQNDQERFPKRDSDFFNYLQPEMHHSNTPSDGINIYSFALFPEEHQPSGTSNFSKIENIFLNLWLEDKSQLPGLPSIDLLDKQSIIYVFAFNYNVLRVISGLAGLAYNS
jgi:hypothetical protein